MTRTPLLIRRIPNLHGLHLPDANAHEQAECRRPRHPSGPNAVSQRLAVSIPTTRSHRVAQDVTGWSRISTSFRTTATTGLGRRDYASSSRTCGMAACMPFVAVQMTSRYLLSTRTRWWTARTSIGASWILPGRRISNSARQSLLYLGRGKISLRPRRV